MSICVISPEKQKALAAFIRKSLAEAGLWEDHGQCHAVRRDGEKVFATIPGRAYIGAVGIDRAFMLSTYEEGSKALGLTENELEEFEHGCVGFNTGEALLSLDAGVFPYK
ncbi:hypothetical protein KAZ66_00980 [Candidatus Woesebacteria bacterium]|jgi:hypothetical protein|nr:hypothetical protein [Candidatus Woesebacteria bacterium]